VDVKIDFHSGMPDKAAYCCRLLRKSQAAQVRVAVCGPSELLDRLDVALWTFDALSFLPHVRLRSGASPQPRLARTPVWLLDDARQAPHRDVLVNLGPDLVPGWEGFGRVVEVVQSDDADRLAGRARWRQYGQTGVAALEHHVVGGDA
jgi:DNA polymerase-3 subunit chi